MVQVSPQELRDFAARLPAASFTALAQQLPGFHLGGGMPAADKANQFVKQWAQQVAGFGVDLDRGVDAFRTVAQNAAARFETTDQSAKDVFAEELNPFRGRDWTTSDALAPAAEKPPADTRPPATTADDPEVDILAPGPFGSAGGSNRPVA
jgi:hypothetical protein